MTRRLLSIALLISICQAGWAQESAKRTDDSAVISRHIESYVQAFNKQDAGALVSHWASDGVYVNQDTGERTTGREALQADFKSVFEQQPTARLNGSVTDVRFIKQDVAVVDGLSTLFLGDNEPIRSTFSAVLIKSGEGWLISSVHESDVPSPATAYDALQDLEWLVGHWQDESDVAQVDTIVRWSANRSFLIRSYTTQYQDGEAFEGTQIIGWDPRDKQIRVWTFNSNGSFGQGTASKNGDDWMFKMSQVLSDGREASATQVFTRVDDDTLSVQMIGLSINGEPRPATEPLKVVRLADSNQSTKSAAATTGGTP